MATLWRWLDEFWRDSAHAARSLARTPAFTTGAVLTLAVGLGVATAIFSVVNAVLLAPLPFPQSERLVRLTEYLPHIVPGRAPLERGITHQEFLEWRRQTTTLAETAAIITMGQRVVRTSQGSAGLWGAMVSDNVFAMLGGRAWLGRTLGEADATSPDVVVLSFETWQRHFQGDPFIVGQPLTLRSGGFPAPPAPPRVLTVVGVMPAGFSLPTGSADYFIPIALDPSRPSPSVIMLGRLAPGVSLDAAMDEANTLGPSVCPPRSAAALPPNRSRFALEPLKDRLIQPVRPALQLLLAAVAVVLLIVCANVAHLLLARGASRRREFAVRVAVGASRARIARQILAECAVLGVAGGIGGVAIGALGVSVARQMATVEAPGVLRLMFGATILPRANEVGADLTLLAIGASLAALASVLFGLLPALHLSRPNQLAAMRSPTGGQPRGDSALRSALVVSQVLMATLLLVGAGLLGRSLVNLRGDRGYDPSNVLTFQLLLPDQFSLSQKMQTIDDVLGRLRSLPRVAAAGFARHGFLIREELFIGTFVPPGRDIAEAAKDPLRSRVRAVSAGFLAAMGVPILEGRELSTSDDSRAPLGIVLNRAAAQHYFDRENPIGRVLDWHLGERATQVTVLGVVEDVRDEALSAPRHPEVFIEYRQLVAMLQTWGHPEARQVELALGLLSFALRTPSRIDDVIPLVRETVRSVHPGIGIDSMLPMDRMVGNSLARERFRTMILVVFAVAAALLAITGIAALLAYTVVQRTRELGIRIALGARGDQVLMLVLRRGVMLTVTGVLGGLAVAAAATSYLESMLFGVTPLDPWTFAGVALTFTLIGALASYVPARRAARVQPVIALRCE